MFHLHKCVLLLLTLQSMQHIQLLIVNQQSLQNSLHASVSHLLLVVAAQAILMACLEHQNL